MTAPFNPGLLAAATPAVGTVCSLNCELATILADYAAGHCDAVDLWLGHAERVLETGSPESLRDLVAASGIKVVAASYQGGLVTADGAAGEAGGLGQRGGHAADPLERGLEGVGWGAWVRPAFSGRG